jgi:D-alanyl-D-alanine dipeptidase
VQQRLWAYARANKQTEYVSNPAKGSIHNYGFALDVTLADAHGRELDMGTPFDSFGPLSQPAQEERLLREGALSAAQVANRRLLRTAMQRAGFRQHPVEWWHFDAVPASAVRRDYPIIE